MRFISVIRSEVWKDLKLTNAFEWQYLHRLHSKQNGDWRVRLQIALFKSVPYIGIDLEPKVPVYVS